MTEAPRRPLKKLVVGVVVALVIVVAVVRPWRRPRVTLPRSTGSSSAAPADVPQSSPRETGRVLVTVPKGYVVGRPIPVVLAMHGWRSSPEDFTGPVFQRGADVTDVAFVSVSGTRKRSETSFEWTEDLDLDRERVRAALAEASDRVTTRADAVVLMGFSQGGQMALALAMANPQTFVGAIALSPGVLHPLPLDELAEGLDLSGHHFVVSIGGGEDATNLALVERDVEALRRAGGEVLVPAYPAQREHSFPRDFAEVLPKWVGRVLSARR